MCTAIGHIKQNVISSNVVLSNAPEHMSKATMYLNDTNVKTEQVIDVQSCCIIYYNCYIISQQLHYSAMQPPASSHVWLFGMRFLCRNYQCQLFAICDCVHRNVPGERPHIFPTCFAIVAHIHLWYEVRHTWWAQVRVHTTWRGRVERGEVREVMQKAETKGRRVASANALHLCSICSRNILGLQLHTNYWLVYSTQEHS